MRLKYRAVHRASDRIEPRMAKAIALAAERLRSRLPLNKLEEALERKDLRAAGNIVSRIDFADAYLPSAEILKEAIVKGGKVAAAE